MQVQALQVSAFVLQLVDDSPQKLPAPPAKASCLLPRCASAGALPHSCRLPESGDTAYNVHTPSLTAAGQGQQGHEAVSQAECKLIAGANKAADTSPGRPRQQC